MSGMKKELGKYFIDISKLIFGGVVLSQIINITENKHIVLILGVIAAALFAIMGFGFINTKKKKK